MRIVTYHGRPVARIHHLPSGRGAERETVTVEIAARKASGAVAAGRWKVTLPPLAAGGPYTLKVTGNNVVTLENVLCGDPESEHPP